MKTPDVLWHFFRAGHVERGRRYEWRDAYAKLSTAGVEYPWHTKREAQAYARRCGARAVFHDSEQEARRAQKGGR